MPIDKEAQHIVKKGIAAMIMDQPFFAMLALQLNLREELTLPTLATDAVNLLYNPNYVKTLSMEQVKAAVAHEVMHVAFMHTTRRHEREPTKWNCAGDYCINPILKDSNFTLHPTWLYDDQYREKGAEEVYLLLPEPPKGQCWGDCEAQGGDGQDDQGSGKQSKKGHLPGQACGGLREPKHSDGSRYSEQEQKDLEHQTKVNVSNAATAAKNMGKLPGDLARFVDELLHPKVPWQDHLRRFLEQVTRNDYNWTRPNRRHMMNGWYLPTLYSLDLGEIVVAIDTSGSIGHEQICQFGAELSAILDTLKPEKVYVVYCDTQVNDDAVQEFTAADLPLDLKPWGGGGTDFRPPFDWVERMGVTPQCMIYFTDLYCNQFPEEPGYQTFWACFHGDDEMEVPFGEKVIIE